MESGVILYPTPDIVDTDVMESGPRADALPHPLDVGHVRRGLSARNDLRNFRIAR